MNSVSPSIVWRNILLAGLMITAALAAANLRASAIAPSPGIDLLHIVPERFAGWQIDQNALVSPIQADATPAAPGTYAQTLERVYRDADGTRIMLSIAYGSQQRGDRLQAHRPEYCYRAQGFEIRAVNDDALRLPEGHELSVRRLAAERPGRSEPISYWLTVGDQATLPGVGRKIAQMRQVFSGQIPDGVLVRISTIDTVAHDAYRQHDRFITDLLTSIAVPSRERLAGRFLSEAISPRSPT